MHLFQGFWHGRPLPILQWACLSSFVDRGHAFDLYAYSSLDAPPGVSVRDAAEVIPYEKLFYFDNSEYQLKDYGPFSDVFRFSLLQEQGGWWVDLDVLCAKSDFPDCEYAWAQELPEIDVSKIGTSQLKLPARDPLTTELYNACVSRSVLMLRREEIGPQLISETLAKRNLPQNHWGSADLFYPLRWIEAIKLWIPEYFEEIVDKVENAYFISCWNSMFTYLGLSTDIMPPKGSYLDKVYREFAKDRMTNTSYSASEVLALATKWYKQRRWAVEELKAVGGHRFLQSMGISA